MKQEYPKMIYKGGKAGYRVKQEMTVVNSLDEEKEVLKKWGDKVPAKRPVSNVVESVEEDKAPKPRNKPGPKPRNR